MLRPGIIVRAWEFSRRYLVVLILIFIFGWTVIEVYLRGVGPTPQQPPTGYVEERLEARLQCHGGNINRGQKKCKDLPEGIDPRFKQSCLESIKLQVSADDPSFKKPFVDKPVSGNTHHLRNLEPGHTYYWRLVQGDTVSTTYTFKTAPYAVKF